MTYALGLVETKGLIGAITAADAMAKAADVKVMGKEKINPALVTIQVIGEVAAVRSAVEAGARAAQQVGQLVSTHIIPRPDLQLANLYPELIQEKGNAVSVPEITAETKNTPEVSIPVEPESEITVVAASEVEVKTSDEENEVAENNSTDTLNVEPVTEQQSTDEVPEEAEVVATDDEVGAEPVVDETIAETEAAKDDTAEVKEDVTEPAEAAGNVTPAVEEATIKETTPDVTEIVPETDAVNEQVSSAVPETEEVEAPEETITEQPVIEQPVKKEKPAKTKKQEPDLFSMFEPAAPAQEETGKTEPEVFEPDAVVSAPEVKEDVTEVQETLTEPEVSEDAAPEQLSTQPVSENLKDIIEDVPSETTEIVVEDTAEVKQPEISSATQVNPELEAKIKELEMRNVEELRRLARTHPDFPIKGRDISKAGRKDLLDYFRQIL